MSYEGSEEFLCRNGHYTCLDCHDETPKECSFCGATMLYWHAIDETNGEEDDNPSTKPAPKTDIGFDERWRTDHHGNRYALKIPRYDPGAHWHMYS